MSDNSWIDKELIKLDHEYLQVTKKINKLIEVSDRGSIGINNPWRIEIKKEINILKYKEETMAFQIFILQKLKSQKNFTYSKEKEDATSQ